MLRLRLHDRYQEFQVFKTRLGIMALVCLLFMTVLVFRLIILQIFNHDVFSTLSQNNRLRLMAVAPNRGLIYDRNGVVLAENRPSYRLEVVPEEAGDFATALAMLRQVITIEDQDVERYRKELKRRHSFEGVSLRFNLSEEEVAHFAVNRHRFPGIDIVAGLSRYYPFREMTAHMLGYVGRIDENDLTKLDEGNYRATSHIGKVGIEHYYEQQLHGISGYQQVEVNVEGRVLRVLKEQNPVPGSDLQLSIDIRLQSVAEAALGEEAGSVVAIEPATGAVLALVSKPAYDPNLFVNGISTENYRALEEEPGRPLFNRALRGQYPPGSTIKPLFGLAALEQGILKNSHDIYCRGFYQLPRDRRRYRDWKKNGHDHVYLYDAVVQSCDVFFYDLAHRMGIDAIAEYVKQFGFGHITGIDLEGEKPGLLPTREWKQRRFGEIWYPGETLSSGIGQGYNLATPLQLAYMTAVMANKGLAFRPHLAETIYNPDGTEQKISPLLQHTVPVKQQRNWDYIQAAMVGVVHDLKGTARSSGLKAPYKIAGKTGTAQVISIAQNEEYDEEKIDKRHRDHALFIAYAPAEKPELAVAVLVENGGHGSSTAAPIARKIFDQYLIARMPE